MIIRQVVKKHLEVPGLGQRLKEAQEKSDYNVGQACRRIGVSTVYWNDLVGERVKISLDRLRSIEAALGVDFGVTMEGATEE